MGPLNMAENGGLVLLARNLSGDWTHGPETLSLFSLQPDIPTHPTQMYILQEVINQRVCGEGRQEMQKQSAMPWTEFEPLMEGGLQAEVMVFLESVSLGAPLTSKVRINAFPRSSAFRAFLKPGTTAICWKT